MLVGQFDIDLAPTRLAHAQTCASVDGRVDKPCFCPSSLP
jgi:hypothetical protein